MFLREPRYAAAVALIVTTACLCTTWVAITRFHLALPLASPLAGIALAYLLWSWRRLDALLVFLRERIDALVAVPAGPFEPPIPHDPTPLDTVDRFTLALDNAIRRLAGLQSLLADGVWLMPVAVLVCGPDGVIRQSNAAARALLARDPTSRPDGPIELGSDPLAGIDLPALLATLPRSGIEPCGAAVDGGLWALAETGEYVTPEGRVFRLRAAPLSATDEATRPGWIVVVRDLTLERTAQRERERWFGFLSHDLRSPQVTILSLLELHRKGDQGIDDARLVNGIDREARRTIRLTENIMDIIDVESRTTLQFAETSIGTIVLDAIDSAWPYALSRRVLLVPRLSESDCQAWADPGLLARALLNLLNNAIRHSAPDTQIRICLATAQEGDAEPPIAVLSIRDEGEGMNTAQLNHVRSAKDVGAGTRDTQESGEVRRWGVGISVVHAIIAKHGGSIDATSAPGAGTMVFLTLPLLQAGQETTAETLTATQTP
jgi:signal transduction histidine kinase